MSPSHPGAIRRERRNALIAEAYAAGTSVRELAQRFGLSRVHVRQVLHDRGVTVRPYVAPFPEHLRVAS